MNGLGWLIVIAIVIVALSYEDDNHVAKQQQFATTQSKDVTEEYYLPKGIEDCKVYTSYHKIRTYEKIIVLRCGNTTNIQYNLPKQVVNTELVQ